MKRCKLVIILVLLAAVGLGAQSLDLTAGAGAGLGGNFMHGFWPSFSATGWIDQNVGFEGGIAFNVGTSVRNYAAEGNLAVRAAAKSWTPEFLLGYARLQTAQPKCSLCLINPLAPAAFSLPKYNTFDLGVAVKHYVSGGAFFQADFRTYFGGGSEFGQPWRFAFSIGYTIGKH
ncbi:MAG: hypothetical protein EPN33_01425 [Acidobacteria bacterium]|nr:MAG: hypothetical protein EPN33_01425 [Acidobacteriota bacterium]